VGQGGHGPAGGIRQYRMRHASSGERAGSDPSVLGLEKHVKAFLRMWVPTAEPPAALGRHWFDCL